MSKRIYKTKGNYRHFPKIKRKGNLEILINNYNGIRFLLRYYKYLHELVRLIRAFLKDVFFFLAFS